MFASVLCLLGAALTLTLALVLGDAAPALAWGPGVHMATANFCLAHLQVLTPPVAQYLTQHPRAFLYGCLSADIFIGKGSSVRPGHSHNWDTAFRLLSRAGNPRLLSHAYGYLAHLAADVIAHNYYVPNLLAATPRSGRLSHVLLEAQADRQMDWSGREAADLVQLVRNGEADACLLDATAQKRWSFLLKKHVYRRGLSIWDAKPWQNSIDLMSRAVAQCPPEDQLGAMLDLSLRAVVSVLANPADSPVLGFDPIGSRNLGLVGRLKRRSGTLLARGRLESPFHVDGRLTELPQVARTHDQGAGNGGLRLVAAADPQPE